MENIKSEVVISLERIEKKYYKKMKKIVALTNVNLEFRKGNFYAIKGQSGSGKSTLINILGLIDNFDNGTYHLLNNDITVLSDKELSKLRMKNIGFIFQDFHLNDYLKAFENVIIPMIINKDIDKSKRNEKAQELLDIVGLSDRFNHFPNELSGGEQQRVAIARALANDPSIILADEPTGNLDKLNEKIVFEKLQELAKNDKCVIVVSHSDEVNKYADIILTMENGEFIGEEQ
ncbi:MAG: ABC transporter ATP-binding protein [Bacilli bacterium]|nr:ABC transporter ATP-binding protein [Bacilli bacterium]MDD4406738.1 ABC transporter ATP-binding protein [Bacilli bacterium]